MKLSFNMQGFTAKKADQGVDIDVGPIALELEYTTEEFIALTEKQLALIAQLIALLK